MSKIGREFYEQSILLYQQMLKPQRKWRDRRFTLFITLSQCQQQSVVRRTKLVRTYILPHSVNKDSLFGGTFTITTIRHEDVSVDRTNYVITARKIDLCGLQRMNRQIQAKEHNLVSPAFLVNKNYWCRLQPKEKSQWHNTQSE